MMPTFAIHERSGATPMTLVVAGELDAATSEPLAEAIQGFLLAHPNRLELDLSEVTFCDSTAVRTLEFLRVEAEAMGARFRLVGASRAVRRVLAMSPLEAYLRGDERRVRSGVAPYTPLSTGVAPTEADRRTASDQEPERGFSRAHLGAPSDTWVEALSPRRRHRR